MHSRQAGLSGTFPLFNCLGLRFVPRLFLVLSLACTAIVIAAFTPSANAKERDWHAFNLGVVTHHILPAYQALETSAANLATESQQLCTHSNTKQLDQARAAFHLTMDAWQAIQHIAFGPIEYDMRSHKLYFWPDKKNHTGKQLAKLFKSEDVTRLEDEAFQYASVSIKGLPAIERILFAETALEALQSQPFRCQVLVKISTHVREISQALAKEWLTYMLPQFKDSQQVDGYFEDDIDAATALLKALVEPLEIIKDLKLLRPLGSEFGKQKPKRLESWRSERSLDNLRHNLLAARVMLFGNEHFKGLAPHLGKSAAAGLAEQLTAIEHTLQSIEPPLFTAISTDKGYDATKRLATQLSQLHTQLEALMSGLGIHLGFNSRDGD